MSEFNLSDKRKELRERLSNFPSIAHHIVEFLDKVEQQDKEFIKRLKQYTNEGWNNPDKKNMINKIDKLLGKYLI